MTMEMPSNISIRKMELKDIDAVHQLDQRSFSTPWARRSFVFELEENEASRSWVAEIDEERKVVGSIICWLLVDEIHIATLAVDQAYQRKYIAKNLLCHALISMMKEGALSAILDVREGNLPAQAMYRKFGFEIVGRRPGYYKNNSEAALLMTLKELNVKNLSKLSCFPEGINS